MSSDTPEDDLGRIGSPVDWASLFAGDEPSEDWLLEPLLARGRSVSLYSAPKVGKSLLALEVAAALAAGRRVLGRPTVPCRVLYIDHENSTAGDVRPRLQAMGYGPEDLGSLVYFSFPRMEGLDTRAGGAALLQLVHRYVVDVVVIDTVSRTNDGEENDNNTWLRVYARTIGPLKRAGVAVLRLDHSGKDASRGQRGGSAKAGDVDAVWRLSATRDGVLALECEDSRQPLPERTIRFRRTSDPLRHERVDQPDRVADLIRCLGGLELPLQAGRDAARRALDDAGVTASTDDLAAAIRHR